MIDRIAALMEYDTAGDPMSGLKWTARTTERVACELRGVGIEISARTVSRLLKQMGYSLRVNHKKLPRVSKTPPHDRNAQFEYIAELRKDFTARGIPLISVDAKKKELIGLFKNPGATWSREPIEVNDHDFPSDAIGKALPYGIYDISANRGTVFVGTSSDTAEFAVDVVERWWRDEGRHRYPTAKEIGILADGGGSNGSRNRAWKYGLCHKLAERYGINVTVAHYPPGTSKWNPIEHRLFSEISKNWAGRPLDTYEAMLNYIRTTTTTTGLEVDAHLVEQHYEKGIKITDAQMRALPIAWHKSLPRWNYTLMASRPGLTLSSH